MVKARASSRIVAALAVVILVSGACAQPVPEAILEKPKPRPYLGENPPGGSPALFAPGIVSTNSREWSMASTPDGLELFFGVVTDERSWILHTQEVDGAWTELAVASFSGNYNDYDLTMSPDGNRLYFTSNRPPDLAGPVLENSDIWYVDRSDGGWGEPVRFPDPVTPMPATFIPRSPAMGTCTSSV